MKWLVPALVGLIIVGGYAAFVVHRARTGLGSESAPGEPSRVAPDEVRFLKGQTHAHSNRSGDSDTAPADVARWYSEHGFDFVVFTDHNFVGSGASHKETLGLPGVELTQNLEGCDEPPPTGGNACLLHVNALFADPARTMGIQKAASTTRVELFTRALEATAAMNGLAQINHPNFQYAADAKVLTALARRGATFLEIANEASDSNNEGDATHPSTEALWDAVLSDGVDIWGVATDDAHHYYDVATARPAYPGDLGFVMVRARKDLASIRDAMARGDFYASTGLLLAKLEVKNGAIELQTEAEADFRCIADKGVVLSSSRGLSVRCEAPSKGYVRAVAENAAGKKAWSQPARRR